MTTIDLRVLLIATAVGCAIAAAPAGRAVADDRPSTTVEPGGAGPRDINYVPSSGVSTTSNGQAIEATTPDVAVSSPATTVTASAPAASAVAPAMTPSPVVTGTSSASPSISTSPSFSSSSSSSSSATSSFSSSASGSSSMPF
jgi:hypothetical protein